MKNRRRFRWWLLAICPLGLLLLAVWWHGSGERTPLTTSREIGSVQVLGGPDEAWLFIEEIIRVDRGMYASPTTVPVAWTQEGVIVTPRGLKFRTASRELKGTTLNPMVGRVFRGEDGFYLVQGQSTSFDRSVCRWQEDHFELLPGEESERLLMAYGLSDASPPLDSALDRNTENNGWKVLYRGDGGRFFLTPETFTWSGRRFVLEVEHGPPVRYLLCCTGPGDPWNVLLLDASATQKEITPEEYDELTSVPKS